MCGVPMGYRYGASVSGEVGKVGGSVDGEMKGEERRKDTSWIFPFFSSAGQASLSEEQVYSITDYILWAQN